MDKLDRVLGYLMWTEDFVLGCWNHT